MKSGRRFVSRGKSRRLNEFSFLLVNIFTSQERSFPSWRHGGVRLFFTFSSKSTRSAYDDTECLPLKSHVPLLFVGFRWGNKGIDFSLVTRCFRIGPCRRLRFTACLQSRATLFENRIAWLCSSHWPEKCTFARTNNSIMLINQTLSIHFLSATSLRLRRAGCDPRGSWNLINPGKWLLNFCFFGFYLLAMASFYLFTKNVNYKILSFAQLFPKKMSIICFWF